MTDNGWKWDVDLMSKILDEDEEAVSSYVGTIDASIGDVYCFWGNKTMHEISKHNSPTPRKVFVTAFSTNPHFSHSDSVHQLNVWDGQKSGDRKHEL